MTTLAWHDGGPGPWILFLPLIWAAAVATVITVLRRTAWRGRGGEPWRRATVGGEHTPIAVLGRRFAAGEIDEDEYWRRLSVLDEHFGRDLRGGKGGSA
ncbi:putative membrane protein [Streptomyces sp. DvalAA-14]|uniref:SHOCT domain-containing protein n=1 Tax=unclassified Streptomyces TaxID=2593676 RepID=UPI00081B681B|nr:MULTISPECIES: SHOCT domain-containing protein [unclassified Streptomyces]MYS18931.1 SHOCT domain-containing protein [Streptomyces sp. SID4948]SCD32148.1 putative membrane protein [Streptomyces sp. DvalAA-14]